MKLSKRQKEIIDAALRITAKGGIQYLTVKNLSKEVGITEPALYRHFKNKAEIIRLMIIRFDLEIPDETLVRGGLEGVKAFLRARFAQVNAVPELARVMFAEELFMDDPEFSDLMSKMMKRHREMLGKALRTAQEKGEIRKNIPLNTLFRILIGPARLLIKQWGMMNGEFDLLAEGEALLRCQSEILTSP